MIPFERPACYYWGAVLALVAATATTSHSEALIGGAAVYLEAKVIADSKAIELHWNPGDVPGNPRLRKRLPGSDWQILNNPRRTDCRYTDFNVVPGTVYEYSMEVVGEDQQVEGTFLWSGIDVPAIHQRGNCLLVVESGLGSVQALSQEISTFIRDLEGDGWVVARVNVALEAPIIDIKEKIRTHFASTEVRPGAVILIGRVPVPYSGIYAPDGHFDHHGAWPADAWYGDLGDSANWTDTLADTTIAATPANWNVPGDGKFDQITLPNSVSLQVGRIDLSRMSLASNESEEHLIRRYLQKNHQYRFRQEPYADVSRRGLVDDNVGLLNGERFADSAVKHFAAFFGSHNVVEGDWFTRLGSESFLWAIGNGLGSFTSCSGIGTTGDFADRPSRAVFTMFGGSYFGDWNTPNNFLRAPLAGDESLGLVSLWTGRPNWVLHPMALGATVGRAAQLTQNNTGLQVDYPDGSAQHRTVHIGLMGDPTLRLHYLEPPPEVTADLADGGHGVAINWMAPESWTPDGYHVYRGVAGRQSFELLNAEKIDSTSFVDRSVQHQVPYEYMVRAVVRETSGSGTYWNLSQGAFTESVIVVPSFSGPEIGISLQGEQLQQGGVVNLRDDGVAEFTITNSGNSSLFFTTIPAVMIDAQEAFDVVNPQSPPLAAGESHTFSIVYSPDGMDAESTMLSIASNDDDESIFQLELRGAGRSPVRSYTEWVTQFPQLAGVAADPAADSDFDGLGNFLEYAFGGNPSTPDSVSIVPRFELIDSNHAGGARFRVRFRQLRDVTGLETVGLFGADYLVRDVRYVVEVSMDGVGWVPDPELAVQIESLSVVSAAVAEVVAVVQTGDSAVTIDNIRFRAEPAPAPRRYEAWAMQFGDERVFDTEGDPDEDGLINLLEYAFGGDPLRRDSSNIAAPELRLIVDPADGSEVIEIASRQLEPVPGTVATGTPGVDYRLGDLRYRVEISTDMTRWLSGPLTLRTMRPAVSNDDGTLTAFVSPWVPASFFERGLFARLTVSLDNVLAERADD